MRRKIMLLFLCWHLCALVYAQKEGNVWTFPDSLGIDFNNTANPVTFTSSDGQIGGHFPAADNSTIADSSGNLFCYSTGVNWGFNSTYVYDRTQHLMANGSNLKGNGVFSSLLLPYPGIDSLIFLLHLGRDPVNTNYFPLYFSIINKNLNNGLGDVIVRDSLVYYAQLSETKLAAVKHANGRDWWIFTYNYTTGKYVYFLLTPSGISFSGIQNIGSNANDLFYGKLVFSNDGTKMMGVGVYGHIDVFDFDRCSGLLSNYRDIGEHLLSEPYAYSAAAFSPNGNVIYVSPFYFTKVFYQWDLNAANIQASKTLINSYPDTGIIQGLQYYYHNLAPDGKIYIPKSYNYTPNSFSFYTSHLDVIENPDVVGTGCNYIVNGFDLGNSHVQGFLPNMPYYGLGAVAGSICDSIISTKDLSENKNGLEIFPNPSNGIFSFRLTDTGDKISSVHVENMLGRKIMSDKNFSSTLDISTFPPGIYVVHVQTQKKKLFAAKMAKR